MVDERKGRECVRHIFYDCNGRPEAGCSLNKRGFLDPGSEGWKSIDHGSDSGNALSVCISLK